MTALKKWNPSRRSIDLTGAEIQSGVTRVRWAEGLILQLPETHDGRNSWLLNYGVTPESDKQRLRWETENGRPPTRKVIEAGTAETVGLRAKHESAGPATRDAPNTMADLRLAYARIREALERALTEIRDHEAAELNLSNYDHDDVAALNQAWIEVHFIARESLSQAPR